MIDVDLTEITAAPGRILVMVLAATIWTATCVGAGYMWKSHRVEVAEAETAGKQQAVQAPVTAAAQAIDTSAITRRDAAIETTQQRTVYVTRLIEKEAHANPAPDACRLPDSLRDEINRDLAPDRLEPADPL